MSTTIPPPKDIAERYMSSTSGPKPTYSDILFTREIVDEFIGKLENKINIKIIPKTEQKIIIAPKNIQELIKRCTPQDIKFYKYCLQKKNEDIIVINDANNICTNLGLYLIQHLQYSNYPNEDYLGVEDRKYVNNPIDYCILYIDEKFVGILLAQRGECSGLYEKTWSVKLICTVPRLGYGKYLIGIFLYSLIHNDYYEAVLQLAFGMRNMAGFCLYTKFGFQTYPEMKCPEYTEKALNLELNNIKMIVNLRDRVRDKRFITKDDIMKVINIPGFRIQNIQFKGYNLIDKFFDIVCINKDTSGDNYRKKLLLRQQLQNRYEMFLPEIVQPRLTNWQCLPEWKKDLNSFSTNQERKKRKREFNILEENTLENKSSFTPKLQECPDLSEEEIRNLYRLTDVSEGEQWVCCDTCNIWRKLPLIIVKYNDNTIRTKGIAVVKNSKWCCKYNIYDPTNSKCNVENVENVESIVGVDSEKKNIETTLLDGQLKSKRHVKRSRSRRKKSKRLVKSRRKKSKSLVKNRRKSKSKRRL